MMRCEANTEILRCMKEYWGAKGNTEMQREMLRCEGNAEIQGKYSDARENSDAREILKH